MNRPRFLLAAVVVVATVAGAAVLGVEIGASAEDGNDDTRENATALQMNSTVEGTIDGPNDTDWYAVEAGDVKRLLVGLYAEESNRDGSEREVKRLSVTLYGPDGERLSTVETEAIYYSQERAGVNHAVESGDTYYVEIASEYDEPADNPDAEEATGSRDYELDVESVPLDTNEPNDDSENATDLATGETVSANILRTESDTYAVKLEEGENVTVTYNVTARLNHNGAAMPTKTYVENSSSENVAPADYQNTPTGNSTYTFTANESGTYFVAVTANTDLMVVSGVRGNHLTQYDLRVDVSEGSPDGGEPSGTPTATATASPPSDDDSSVDGGQDIEESGGTTDGGGDQQVSYGGDDQSDTQTPTSVPPTATSTETPSSIPPGTDVTEQVEAPAEQTRTDRETPVGTTDEPAAMATEAPGQPGFGFAIAIGSASIAAIAAICHHRRSRR